MSEKVSFKSLCVEWVISLTVMVVLTMACNIVGYGGRFLESIPGMLILCVISFLGLTAKHFIPSSLPAVTYIGIIGMLAAVPASPVSAPIIYWTGKIDLMASITPILAFAGVLLGKYDNTRTKVHHLSGELSFHEFINRVVCHII